MEQKPGLAFGSASGATGTPNPLNPNSGIGSSVSSPDMAAQHVNPGAEISRPNVGATMLDANPSEAMTLAQPVQLKQPIAPKRPAQPERLMRPAQPVQPVQSAQPTQPEQPMGVVTDMNGMPTETTFDPLNRPMQKAVDEVPVKPKKKKTGLIVGAIVCLVLALGCGVAAAVVIANLNRGDVVTQAFEKLLSGKAPTNLAMDGTISVDVLNEKSYITDAQISVQGEMVPGSTINAASAKINLNTVTGRSYTLTASEVYAADGDLYLKFDGITNLLSEVNLQTTAETTLETEADPEVAVDPEITTNTVTTEETTEIDPEMSVETEMSKWMLAQMVKMFEVVDGEWLRIPTDSVGAVAGLGDDSVPVCTVKFVTELNSNSNSLIGAYNRNPFIGSMTENLKIASEQNPIYRLTINTDNLAGFFNNSVITTAAKNYTDCLGQSSGEMASASEVATKVVEGLPELYVEIDNNYNFTRFYTETGDDSASVKVDLRFNYPNNVNISEPTEYKDFSTILEEVTADIEARFQE